MFVESVFYISFVGIFGMITFKAVESRMGKVQIWSRYMGAADARVHIWRQKLTAKYQLWKKIAYLFVFEFLPAYAYRQVVRLKDYLYKKYYESSEKFKGEKRMLKSNGSVSEFLQNLSEEGKMK